MKQEEEIHVGTGWKKYFFFAFFSEISNFLIFVKPLPGANGEKVGIIACNDSLIVETGNSFFIISKMRKKAKNNFFFQFYTKF